MKETMVKSKRPLPASTVILVRDDCGSLQVYLVARSKQASFMPGNYVFPGGKVDPVDRNGAYWITAADLNHHAILQRFGDTLQLDELVSFCVTAVRETFEEIGVFLAQSPRGDHRFPEDQTAARLDGGLKKGWLRDAVEQGGWKLSFSRLFAWSHWITPKAMPLRFDTRFFVAPVPPGQECSPDRNEISRGIWMKPMDALARNTAGEIPLSPPTLATLHSFKDCATVEEVLQKRNGQRWGATQQPKLIFLSETPLIVLPWDPSYDHLDSKKKGARPFKWLAPGEPFSRLLYHDGLWRPVKMGRGQ
jgi:8-oxo-dGTP pyrophosphatase MutT (NUDIX family)